MKESLNTFNWSLIISSVLVIIGWGIGYYITNLHQIKNKQREIITGYLIEAYRNIEEACARGDSITNEQKRKMEKAIADIQLFGSPKQVNKAKEFTEQMNKNSYGDPRKLLVELRNDLREELGIKPASKDFNDIIHWRLK